MRRDFQRQKRLILGTLALFLVADLAMAAYTWQMASASSSPQQLLAEQNTRIKLLRADLQRARGIRKDIPIIKADCDRFEASLPSGSSGYSEVSSELYSLAGKAGLQIASLGFRPKELLGRGITEVALDATVSGDYQSVVRFFNGVQRSENYYVVGSLTIDPDSSTRQRAHGSVRVILHLTSYFKGAA